MRSQLWETSATSVLFMCVSYVVSALVLKGMEAIEFPLSKRSAC